MTIMKVGRAGSVPEDGYGLGSYGPQRSYSIMTSRLLGPRHGHDAEHDMAFFYLVEMRSLFSEPPRPF